MDLALNRADVLARIQRAFAESLALDTIRPDDDYFQLGGTSLGALRLVRDLRTSLDPRVRMADVIRHPTAGSLADALIARLGDEDRT